MRKVAVVSLLGVFFLVSGCPKKSQTPKTQPPAARVEPDRTAPLAFEGPFMAPLLTGPRSVLVHALWVRKKTDPKTKKQETIGGVTQVRLRVAPNPEMVTTVGVAEQFPGGAGVRWKSSVWLAAISACQALGREIPEYEFLADSRGFIDGGSAGALFTAGFMAAILGDAVIPTATMTGTVNPDGTVGLVGGLEEKLMGAIKAGKRIIGYPEGNRLVKGKGERIVDLENLAAENGAKAVQIRDIFEAYKLLTGKEFPGRKKAEIKLMEVDSATAHRLKALTEGWRVRHNNYIEQAKKWLTDPMTRRFYEKALKPALIYKDVSAQADKQNQNGAAWYAAVRSSTWAHTAANHSEIIFLWRQWIELVNKQYMQARMVWFQRWRKMMEIRRKQRMEEARQAKVKKCKAEKWKSAECKKLRVEEAKRKKAAEKVKKAAEKARKAAEKATKVKAAKAKARKPAARRRVAVKPVLRPVVRPVPKVPPEPPKDFLKLLVKVAEEMEERTKSVKQVTDTLSKVKPTSLDQALALISAYEELIQGAAFALIANLRFKAMKSYSQWAKRMTDAMRKRLFAYRTGAYVEASVRFAGIAYGKSNLASEHSGLFTTPSPNLSVSDERMKSITRQLFSAAKTNVEILSAMIPQGFQGFIIQRYLSSNIPTYVIARLGYLKAGEIMLKFREAGREGKRINIGTGYAALGAAVASYMAASKLRWKVHMGISLQPGVKIAQIRRPIVLTNALGRGRMFALEAAYRSYKASKMVPTISKVLFQAADLVRKETIEGQVKAVELYWRAAFYCRLAELLVRKVQDKPIKDASLKAPSRAESDAKASLLPPF